MNISANLYFFNEHCFNIGLFRLSPQKVVTVSHGGYFIRPYVHRAQVFSTKDASVLSKAELSKELSELRSTDNRWNQNVYVSASGGSAGKRLYFLTDIKENLLQRQIFANMMMEHNIICHNDVCLNLFEGGNLYRASDILNDICNFTNCTVLPMHNSASDEHILQTIEYFQPNIFMGTPYRLMQLALFIEQQSGKEITCNKIIFACEPLDEIKQKCFKRVFHCSIFIGVYGSAEAGPFACQLPQYSSTKTYIYPKELVHLEIVDSKIVVTNLIRKINQIIRFDTGDQGRLLPTDENAKYGLVEVLYGERIVCLDNTEFLKSDLEALAKEIDVIEWQLIIDYIPYSRNYQVCLLFRYVQSSLTIDETVQQTIRDYLLKVFKDDLSEFQRQVVLQFEPVDYKDLIRDKVSSKLLKIIDRRV